MIKSTRRAVLETSAVLPNLFPKVLIVPECLLCYHHTKLIWESCSNGEGKQSMEKIRCHWANPKNPLYLQYHDEEWGVPVHDDHKLFEMLILESFQAGLSWECILNKREAFRRAFDEFDLGTVCGYGEEKLAALGQDPGIVRNKLKIHAAVNNARIFRTIQQEWGSFDCYLWHWTEGETIYETGKVSSELSDAVSKDLKRRGMKFVGTVIIYSYLQAVGVINSHEESCFCRRARTSTIHS